MTREGYPHQAGSAPSMPADVSNELTGTLLRAGFKGAQGARAPGLPPTGSLPNLLALKFFWTCVALKLLDDDDDDDETLHIFFWFVICVCVTLGFYTPT